MRTTDVAPYEPSWADAWDQLVASAPTGTLLHTRRFLGYHGDRFKDASAIVLADEELLAVLPAAVDPGDPHNVSSHPGATFGGLVHSGSLTGATMVDALRKLTAHYRGRGFHKLTYAAVPSIYHLHPAADDLYAIWRLNGRLVRRDLSCAIDLGVGLRLSSRRRRGLARARREAIVVVEGSELVDELWPVIELNLAERHNAHPVHSRAEMVELLELFPEQIRVLVARSGSDAVAGVVLFESQRVSHAQYIASTAQGNDLGALDAVFAHCIETARERGARFFDFGTSNRDEGRVLNEGLYGFKAQFGGGGVAYDFYDLPLNAQ